MAGFEVHGIDELLKDLDDLSFERIAPKMLEAAAPVLEKNLRNRAAMHKDSGEMAASVKSAGVKKQKDGYGVAVRATGTDKKGVRNMEKMAYLEYGTYKQAATPVVLPAVRESESAILAKMQEVLEKEVSG